MTPHEAADVGVKTYMLKLGPCSEEDHTRLVNAISDRDEKIFYLQTALLEIGKLSFSDHSNKTLLRITEISAGALYPSGAPNRLALTPRGEGD